jgi:hypothetical protein
MGRRARRRDDGALPAGQLEAPTQSYRDSEGNELELRGALTLKARQRATEWLFERLAVSWTIHGLELDKQKELLGRYRMATADQRQFVRDSLRAHLQEYFPDMQAP